MASRVKCNLCERIFVDKQHLVSHIDKSHGDQIPEGWTASRYENYIRTGKTHGSCVICKKDTPWNNVTEKYCRMCGRKSCTAKAREIAERNLLNRKGVTHSQMLSDPEFQKKMVYSKKTSGTYIFTENTSDVEVKYDSSYGKDFLEMLDHFMGFCGADIMGPSPNTYTYIYDKKEHFYIPDFYIPSLNLEIEIKDGGSNPNMHPKIQKVDKVKERLKDKVLEKSKVNYVKVLNKDYTSFFKMLYELKERDIDKSRGAVTSEEYISILESAEYISTDLEEYTLYWFRKEYELVETDLDITSLYSKLEVCIKGVQVSLNQDDISEDEKNRLNNLITELTRIKLELDEKAKTIHS